MRYAMLLSYDGTNYGGWQIQKNTVTVQQKLAEALEDIIGTKVNVTASGRTDSGVHARAQVCHFDAQTSIPAEKLADALNARLPEDISVLQTVAAPSGFNAQSSAKKKTYCYRFYLSQRRQPLNDRNSVQIKYSVDSAKLEYAAKLFEGEHDFKAYCAAGSQVKTTVRTIYDIKVDKVGCNVAIIVTGNGFLYNMVRTLVGTMIYFAAGRLTEEDIARTLAEGDRNFVGQTMPAKGLTLEKVEYEVELFNNNFT